MRTFALILTIAVVSANGSIDPVEELAGKYKRASSEKERMNVCIEVIDQGVLRPGCSVKVFDAIFGTKLGEHIPEPGDPLEIGGVYFAEQPKIESYEIQTPAVGWYCQVEFGSHGVIHTYHLSNIHK
jgi:hypothetical protein